MQLGARSNGRVERRVADARATTPAVGNVGGGCLVSGAASASCACPVRSLTVDPPLALAVPGLHACGMSSPDSWVSGDDNGNDDEPPDTAGSAAIAWSAEVVRNGYPDLIRTDDNWRARVEPGDLAGSLADDPRSPGLDPYLDPGVAGQIDPQDDVAFTPLIGPLATPRTDAIAEADTAQDGGRYIPDTDDEELLPVVMVEVSVRGPLAGELPPGQRSWIGDDPAAGERAADPTADSSDEAEQEPRAAHGEERTPLDAGLEMMALEREKAPGTPGAPAPAVGVGDMIGAALASADPDASGQMAHDPVTMAEPGSDEKPETGPVAEPALAAELSSPGDVEVALQRAGDILAAIESTVPSGGPDSGAQTARFPAPGREAGPVAAESAAAAREILEHADGGVGAQGESAAGDIARPEVLAAVVVAAIRADRSGQIIDAIRLLTSDPATFENLRRIADDPGVSAETIREATSKARLSGGGTSAADGKLIAALVLLLAAGIMVPVLTGPAIQVILTNEIAIAALAVAVAALRKSS
jgi:hypothetical protein